MVRTIAMDGTDGLTRGQKVGGLVQGEVDFAEKTCGGCSTLKKKGKAHESGAIGLHQFEVEGIKNSQPRSLTLVHPSRCRWESRRPDPWMDSKKISNSSKEGIF